jgi:hypothetical protein
MVVFVSLEKESDVVFVCFTEAVLGFVFANRRFSLFFPGGTPVTRVIKCDRINQMDGAYLTYCGLKGSRVVSSDFNRTHSYGQARRKRRS